MSDLYYVGSYIRLSREGATYANEESMSIENQKEMLTKFISMMPGWVETRFYIDDGFSGGNFDRPAFKDMMEDVRNKKINLVLVKDLSRFGRNYLEAGHYLENELPAYGCRFVSLSDGIDTESGENDIIPFLNAMNDYSLKAISDRIKSVFKAKALDGQKLTGSPPYGYMRNPNDHTRLIVDEFAADIVRKIYDLRVQKLGYAKIASILNNENILPPKTYYCIQNNKEVNPKSSNIWRDRTVKLILNNEIYIGNTIQMKNQTVSYRDSRQIKRDDSEWIRVNNTHMPIIDEKVWEEVQKINKSAKQRANTHRIPQTSLFSGLLICADCGSPLNHNREKQVRKSGVVKYYSSYYCSKYRTSGGSVCSRHVIYEISLKNLVFEQIKSLADQIAFDEEHMLQLLKNRLTQNNSVKDSQKEQKALSQRLHTIEVMTSEIYENKVMGIITEDEFISLLLNLEEEKQQKEKRLSALIKEADYNKAVYENIDRWVSVIKEKAKNPDLDRELLECLIDKIEIGERSVVNGVKTQDIKIYYKFIGCVF